MWCNNQLLLSAPILDYCCCTNGVNSLFRSQKTENSSSSDMETESRVFTLPLSARTTKLAINRSYSNQSTRYDSQRIYFKLRIRIQVFIQNNTIDSTTRATSTGICITITNSISPQTQCGAMATVCITLPLPLDASSDGEHTEQHNIWLIWTERGRLNSIVFLLLSSPHVVQRHTGGRQWVVNR